MKRFVLLFVFSFSLCADWSTRETTTLNITPFPIPAKIPSFISWAQPVNSDSAQKGIQIVVQPKQFVQIPINSTYELLIRYKDSNGNLKVVDVSTRSGKDGIASVFVPCQAETIESITAKIVFPAEEATVKK